MTVDTLPSTDPLAKDTTDVSPPAKDVSYSFLNDKVHLGCDYIKDDTHPNKSRLSLYIRVDEESGREWLRMVQEYVPVTFPLANTTEPQPKEPSSALVEISSQLFSLASSIVQAITPSAILTTVSNVAEKAQSKVLSYFFRQEAGRTILTLPTPKGTFHIAYYPQQEGQQQEVSHPVEIAYDISTKGRDDYVQNLFDDNIPTTDKAATVVRLITEELVSIPFANKLAGRISSQAFMAIAKHVPGPATQ
eukprot:TRINITY_DN13566_c0_g1_i1.p1 TRINITY_DN13566_c0_g1~~TRINITY_DN13566_c0_g1_i1.p1  ORF type:complete len:258 (-),score=63.05 TRINITY_DN13566_c0_g1_i1:4-747(-)